MSIVALKSLVLIGFSEQKEAVYEALQELGCLHLVSLDSASGGVSNVALGDATIEAWQLLKRWHIDGTRPASVGQLSLMEVQERALELEQRMERLNDELELVEARIKEVEPWGDFEFSSLESMGGLSLWFYLIPHHRVSELSDLDWVWQEVGKDHRHCYVVVIARDEPLGFESERQHLGKDSLSTLRGRKAEVEDALSHAQIEGAELARELPRFVEHIMQLQDVGERSRAVQMGYEGAGMFAVKAWVPGEKVETVQEVADGYQLARVVEDVRDDEQPPTLFENPASTQVGESLISFYMTPSYRLWDPSFVVLYSFTLFFAMIMSDAGYGVVMAVLLGVFWKRIESANVKHLCLLLTISTLVWGVLVGSYFGIEPDGGSLFGMLHVLDMQDMDGMMALSIVIGAVHIMLANAIDAWRLRRSAAAWAPLGWIVVLFNALMIYLGGSHEGLKTAGGVGIVTGLVMIVIFTGAGQGHGVMKQLGTGAMALTKLSEAFGNVLSYLRLFALGVASAALAGAFNDLASQANASVKGLGFLLAIVILLVGHTLNFILAIMSGFIHGLRLNLIEFFNWSVGEEGYAFRAFKKKNKPTN
ncbi:V-type ATP synthase subunit I [Rubritalea tangerina]|uniref:V-type ATP synthase subunit I n=1 Tax=Rubritalea tangerina TaxID=430798 RepID=A0ABW4Z6U2_9BACT